jgi:hypothetical protein
MLFKIVIYQILVACTIRFRCEMVFIYQIVCYFNLVVLFYLIFNNNQFSI